MVENTKVKLIQVAKQIAHNLGDKEIVNDLRGIELEERRALLMRIRQIEKNWNLDIGGS